jgi:CheY-like chemotaxis protein
VESPSIWNYVGRTGPRAEPTPLGWLTDLSVPNTALPLQLGPSLHGTPPPPASGERPPGSHGAAPPAAGRARVLVVDDEEMVGRVVQRLLARAYDVQLETDPQTALARLASETYDLILCDMSMPGVSGIDIHERLLSTRPELAERLIFLTGGALSPEVETFLAGCTNPVVHKPFNAQQLLATVAKFLA